MPVAVGGSWHSQNSFSRSLKSRRVGSTQLAPLPCARFCRSRPRCSSVARSGLPHTPQQCSPPQAVARTLFQHPRSTHRQRLLPPGRPSGVPSAAFPTRRALPGPRIRRRRGETARKEACWLRRSAELRQRIQHSDAAASRAICDLSVMAPRVRDTREPIKACLEEWFLFEQCSAERC